MQTPTIDRLAAEGMIFDANYHMGSFSGAVCSPSRHMIMSGRTVWHLPIGPGAKGHCPPELEKNTIPAVFNRAGYDTMRTSKMGNSYEGANKQFTVCKDATKRGGTDESGNAWHAEQVLDYSKQRESSKDKDPFPNGTSTVGNDPAICCDLTIHVICRLVDGFYGMVVRPLFREHRRARWAARRKLA